jgi:hypothetical protein
MRLVTSQHERGPIQSGLCERVFRLLHSELLPETVDHVFQCTAPARQTVLLERFSSFAVHFRSMKTSRSLIGALHSGALAWAEQREPPSVENLDLPDNPMGLLIWQAYAEQTSLGWNALFRGYWATSWRLGAGRAV